MGACETGAVSVRGVCASDSGRVRDGVDCGTGAGLVVQS